MYYFLARYDNMNTATEITKEITFDGQFFRNERECYLYAMSRALDLCGEDECLVSLDFIAC